MQNNVAFLAKKAVDHALKGNWKEAITVNHEIIEKDPHNLDAKVRLGRALLQVKEFNKAKKIFKEVLEVDPINPVALKNYKLATEKKFEKTTENVNPKSLIKEPGTTTEIHLEIEAKRITADDFMVGEEITIKVDKKHVSFFKKYRTGDILLGKLNNDFAYKLNSAKSQGAEITATFMHGNDKHLKILIKSSVPVFKSMRQDVKPYIKKGSIDEPELELPELEE
ncbi:MAG TPA: tetratricopeptide repeat protein [Candidatus Saccharimonadales bacterium]|nr:tetratricopeptide repeat protein [Candidatus Saccharimonadales bacterium]